MRILLADDDRQMVRALSISLRAQGYEVITAHDGREALDAATHQHPELIVLDLGMPGLTGVEVITAVRGWSEMPVLVISGRAESWDKVEALDAGADDYVTKPFAIDELLARVRALARRSAPAPVRGLSEAEARARADQDTSAVYKVGKAWRFAVYDRAADRWSESPFIDNEDDAQRVRDQAHARLVSAYRGH